MLVKVNNVYRKKGLVRKPCLYSAFACQCRQIKGRGSKKLNALEQGNSTRIINEKYKDNIL
jgi:hypothetical protein